MKSAQLTLLSILIIFSASGQSKAYLDSADALHHGKTYYSKGSDFNQTQTFFERTDTGLNHLENYDRYYLRNLGIVGTPTYPIFLGFAPPAGFDWGFHQWDGYRYTSETVKYYNTQNPYTDLFYAQGPVNFQMLRGVHTQNIRPNWNAAIELEKQGNKGFYTNQQNIHNNFAFTTWFQLPNRRYMVFADAIYNSFRFQENGGVSNVPYFEADTNSNLARRRVSVYLTKSKQSWTDLGANVSQFLFFGPSKTIKTSDTGTATRKYIVPRFFVRHDFGWTKKSYKYFEGDSSALFPKMYNNTGVTDSFHARELSNEISFGFMGAKDIDSLDSIRTGFHFPWQARLFMRYDLDRFHQPSNDTTFSNISEGGELSTKDFMAKGQYYISGYNKGDYLITGRLKLPFIPLLKPFAEVRIQRFRPARLYEQMVSNHFIWRNSMNSSYLNELSAGISYSLKNNFTIQATASYGAYSEMAYIDSAWIARQFHGTQSFASLEVQTAIRFGNIHFDNDLRLQQGASVIRAPSLVEQGSIYLQERLFGGRLLARLGVNASYWTGWHAYSYVPDLSAFAIQDKVVIGNYPVADVWLSAKIKSFRFFFRMEHLNQGLNGYNYFLVPNFPLEPRTFRFGLEWTFYN